MNSFRAYILVAFYVSLGLTSLMLAYAGLTVWPALRGWMAAPALLLLIAGAVGAAVTGYRASKKFWRHVKDNTPPPPIDWTPFAFVAFTLLITSFIFTG